MLLTLKNDTQEIQIKRENFGFIKVTKTDKGFEWGARYEYEETDFYFPLNEIVLSEANGAFDGMEDQEIIANIIFMALFDIGITGEDRHNNTEMGVAMNAFYDNSFFGILAEEFGSDSK